MPSLQYGPKRDPFAHSKAVRAARITLPAVAGLVVVTIIAWPWFDATRDTARPGPAHGELELTQARFLGTDTNGRPFEIRAGQVTQLANDQEVELLAPQADITLTGGTWLSIAAQAGHYDQKSQQLDLKGAVSLFHGSGYEFRSTQAMLDIGKGIAWGNTPVEGQGPMGTVEAGGFRVLDDGQVIIFTGKARLRAIASGSDKAATPNADVAKDAAGGPVP